MYISLYLSIYLPKDNNNNRSINLSIYVLQDNKDNLAFLANFDYVNPISPVKQKQKPKSFSRERFKELRAR